MQSSLEVLGVPAELVERERSAGSSDNILKLAEGYYRAIARLYHPDVNPEAAEMLQPFTDAIQDLRHRDGLALAIERQTKQSDRARFQRNVQAELERRRERDSLSALLSLLENIDQFQVLGIKVPTSFILQFESSRTILDVVTHDRAFLSLAAGEIDMLPEQSEAPSYRNGRWSEMFLNMSLKLTRYIHNPQMMGRVDVVGFLPSGALRHEGLQDDVVVEGEFSELGEGFSGITQAPAWTAPSEAWYLPKLTPRLSQGSEVVVRNRHSGHLARIGSIQSSAPLAQNSPT